MDIDRSRSIWVAFGGVLLVALLLFVYSFVGTLVFGLFIYYATRSIYRRVKQWVRPPSVAAGLSLMLFALPGVGLLAYTLLIALEELDRFSQRADLGQYETILAPFFDLSTLVSDPATLLADPSIRRTLQTSFEQALNYAGVIGLGLLHLFVMFAIAFYLLRDGPRLRRWFTGRFGDDRNVLVSYVNAVDRDLHRIFFGNIVNAFATGILGAFAYNGLNLLAPAGMAIPYPTLLGLLTGLASLVPVVGMKLVYVPVAAYLGALAVLAGSQQAIGFVVLFVLVSLVLVDTIPDLVLRPFVAGGGFAFQGSGGHPSLHVGALMFAYIFGPLMFGWYGIFLGPVILVLVVHFARLILPELVEGKPIEPFAVDPSHLIDPSPTDSPSSNPVAEPSGDTSTEAGSNGGESTGDTGNGTPGDTGNGTPGGSDDPRDPGA